MGGVDTVCTTLLDPFSVAQAYNRDSDKSNITALVFKTVITPPSAQVLKILIPGNLIQLTLNRKPLILYMYLFTIHFV